MLRPEEMSREQMFDHLDRVAKDWGIPPIPRTTTASDEKLRKLVHNCFKEGAKLGGGQ
jgi:hypothetical protein